MDNWNNRLKSLAINGEIPLSFNSSVWSCHVTLEEFHHVPRHVRTPAPWGPGPLLFGVPVGMDRWAFVPADMLIIALPCIKEPELA